MQEYFTTLSSKELSSITGGKKRAGWLQAVIDFSNGWLS